MNRTKNGTSQHRPWTPLHPRQHPKRIRTTTGPTLSPSWTPSDPGITGDATFLIGSDASLMPWHQPLCQRFHSTDKSLPHRRNRISGALWATGALLSRGSRKCALLYCLQQYLRAPSGGPARRIECGSQVRSFAPSKGCGPCAAKRLSRGRRGYQGAGPRRPGRRHTKRERLYEQYTPLDEEMSRLLGVRHCAESVIKGERKRTNEQQLMP